MKNNLLINIAAARSAFNFISSNRVQQLEIANQVGISLQDFESKIDVTNFNDHLSKTQLCKLQAVTRDETLKKIIRVINKKNNVNNSKEIIKLLNL